MLRVIYDNCFCEVKFIFVYLWISWWAFISLSYQNVLTYSAIPLSPHYFSLFVLLILFPFVRKVEDPNENIQPLETLMGSGINCISADKYGCSYNRAITDPQAPKFITVIVLKIIVINYSK